IIERRTQRTQEGGLRPQVFWRSVCLTAASRELARSTPVAVYGATGFVHNIGRVWCCPNCCCLFVAHTQRPSRAAVFTLFLSDLFLVIQNAQHAGLEHTPRTDVVEGKGASPLPL
ncbi:unnamed protein product, partial [Ectocarpus sp. 8 AP-2014]